MRLDKYLKVSRLIKRRTVANEACDLGRITVNDRVARASYDVKVGDRIAIHFGERTLAVEVLSVADNVGKADAAALYCLFLAAALLAFTLRIGQGELRLYMLAFIALGAYLSFALLSPLLRPLWDFWADCLFAFARLLRAPLLLVKKYYGKLHKFAKKLFLFSRRTLIIENYKRSARRSRRAAERRGGVQYGRGKGRAQKAGRRDAPEAAASRSSASHRRAPSEPPAGDQPR